MRAPNQPLTQPKTFRAIRKNKTEQENEDFVLSRVGDISIDDKGITTYVQNENGKDYYISTKSNLKNIEKRINEIIEVGSEL